MNVNGSNNRQWSRDWFEFESHVGVVDPGEPSAAGKKIPEPFADLRPVELEGPVGEEESALGIVHGLELVLFLAAQAVGLVHAEATKNTSIKLPADLAWQSPEELPGR